MVIQWCNTTATHVVKVAANRAVWASIKCWGNNSNLKSALQTTKERAELHPHDALRALCMGMLNHGESGVGTQIWFMTVTAVNKCCQRSRPRLHSREGRMFRNICKPSSLTDWGCCPGTLRALICPPPPLVFLVTMDSIWNTHKIQIHVIIWHWWSSI